MVDSGFDEFKRELLAVRDALQLVPGKTVQDDALRSRVQNLFRTWRAAVEPAVRELLSTRRELYKLSAELEALARLTSKARAVTAYRQRITRAIGLAQALVIFLPPSAVQAAALQIARPQLFLDEIPDLPQQLVSSSLLGFRSRMQEFLQRYPFEKSVFVMIRYRAQNAALISRIKSVLADHGARGIVAREHRITDDLYNPIACLLCCARGLAVFDRPSRGAQFNPNVAYELGVMHLLQRPCLILKHESLTGLHTDILMKLYTPYKGIKTATSAVTSWLSPPADE